MPATYEPIASTTLSSAAANIDFTSIPGTYTDLRLVWTGTNSTANQYLTFIFNNITTTTYSQIGLYGTGASANSYRSTSATSLLPSWNGKISTTIPILLTLDIFSYAGSTNKTVLMTGAADLNGSGSAEAAVGLWSSTSAITSIKLSPQSGNFNAGTTATLYGITKA